MSWLLVLPIIVPMTTAVLTFLGRSNRSIEKAISIAGAAALLMVSLVLAYVVLSHGTLAGQMGNWPAPFGITLVADPFSAVMVLITGITGFLIAVYALVDIDPLRQRFGFHGLYHVLLGGVCGAFVTGDLFNLYVWFEVILIASVGLIALGSEKAQLDGTVKYMAVNLVSTMLFLTAVGLLYGVTGTLNMAELHLAVREVGSAAVLNAVAVLFLVAFGIKAAVFPLFFWLPASYHTPPVAVTAIFSALTTKVGVYALIRLFTLVFTRDVGYTHGILLVVAALTMVTGVLGAAAHTDVRRILSFHIISQIGYMVLGLALYTPLALLGAVFYLIHHIIVKANLFLIGGVIRRVGGSFDLQALGGLYRERPLLSVLFLVPALSLAGFPPLSGFWAKLVLLQASLDLQQYLIAAIVLAVGLMTIYSMTKIWTQAFWKPALVDPASVDPAIPRAQMILLMAPIVVLASITVGIGLLPAPFVDVAERAAAELMNPQDYLDAVLAGRR